MKLTELPIWPRILAAKKTISTSARTPIGILRAVISTKSFHALAGPDWIGGHSKNHSRLWLTDYRRPNGRMGGPLNLQFSDRSAWRNAQTANMDKAGLREAQDPKFRRIQVRARAAQQHDRDLVMHIAYRWHNTVSPLYTSKYAGITWGRGCAENKEWDRYSKNCKWPCCYKDAGAGLLDDGRIVLSPTRGKEVFLPRVPKILGKSAVLTEPHPTGLFAVPVKGQAGIFACMGTQKAKWVVVGFCLRGRLVPECVARGTTTLPDIQAQENTETRAVMIERYGAERYIRESGGKEIDHSDLGTLYDLSGLKVVKVVNSTPEPDGRYKNYYLKVPPSTKTAAEAVAWTFALKTEEYVPQIQS